MSPHAAPLTTPNPGFGLGLRTPHYPDFLAAKQPLDWLEIITDNYLVAGGRPLQMLDQIRRDYPVVMHGVAMSLGAPGEVDATYLRHVKALADRVEPLWISDHLCWIGPGTEQLHDLYPLPYTEEAARHLIDQIRRAQDVLQRRLVVENVSSYIEFKHSAATEWAFLSHVAAEADCLLLVDVNNIYVSSVNHSFNPVQYLQGLPRHRVQQIHLAGHSNEGSHIVDTHDHPVADPVWTLYAEALKLFGPVATMIERDDHIPPLITLLDELAIARNIAAGVQHTPAGADNAVQPLAFPVPTQAIPALPQLQRDMASYVLDPLARGMSDHVRTQVGIETRVRLGIYHHAYRARLADVLADVFEKTVLYMGSDHFDQIARGFVVQHPPQSRSLGVYGAAFPAYLGTLYPHNPELSELAQLDWDLRSRFDGQDWPALDTAAAAADTTQAWLTRSPVLHPSVLLREITTNVVTLWNAIHDDTDVPPPLRLDRPATLMVWRKGLQPHFKTLDAQQSAWLDRFKAGGSIADACEGFANSPFMPEVSVFGQWLAAWWEDEILAAAVPAPTAAKPIPVS